MNTMPEEIDTVIVGAGQSALATSYYLKQREIPHVLLEKERICEAWRSGKWDSFTLVSPNWATQLPGHPYSGDNPDGYMGRDDVVRYLDEYVRKVEPPVRTGVEVLCVRPGGARFVVETNEGSLSATNVVVATGAFQKPKIPESAARIDPRVLQLSANQYRNPAQLPEGAVLVVGSGQSGCQIARELNEAGRNVHLCTGRAARLPRRYRGREVFQWAQEMGMFDKTVDTLESPAERFEANPQLTGKDGGSSLNLHRFHLDGISLLGRFREAQGSVVHLADDLHANLGYADAVERGFKEAADAWATSQGIFAPPDDDNVPQLRAGYDAPIYRELNLEAAGIHSIIWATGFRCDFHWIDFPVFDENGYPEHQRGITAQPGLYFIGLLWLHKSKSSLLLGVGEDAAYIVAHIAASS